MIISHKHKFIFLKPRKVAGTSVEINLAKYCGPNDIITKISKYNKNNDETPYKDYSRNYGTFYDHVPADEIKKKIDKKKWNSYFKITIVRNPYDMIISRYFYEEKIENKKGKIYIIKRILRKIFNKDLILNTKEYILNLYKNKKSKDALKKGIIKKYLENVLSKKNNDDMYFDKKGNPICDFYIRFEHLDEDYKKVCKKIGIPYEPLPRTKTKLRKDKKHYSKYYDEKTKEIVAKKFKRQIDYFGYKFEEEQK